MLKLITGRAKSGKTSLLINEIKGRIEDGESKMLLIVPEQYSHEAEREICSVCSDKASLHIEVISFTRLSRRVFAEVGKTPKFMDKSGKILALNRAVNAVGSRLKVYNSAVHKPELLNMLLSITDEFKMAKITSNLLEKAADENEGSLKEKLVDLALITEALEAFSRQSSLDPSDRVSVLADSLRELNGEVFSSVYIDGFVDFTAQERDCIEALSLKCKNLTLCLSTDKIYSDSEVFELPSRTAIWFKSFAENRNIEFKYEQIERKNQNNALEFLEKHLFEYTNETFKATEEISLYSCEDIVSECEFVASYCAELVANGARYKEIAIAIRGYVDYRTALENAFERYSLPLYLAVRSDVMQKPLPLLISSVIDAVTGGFEYESMFSYLKTGLSDLSQTEVDLLENYCITWDVKGAIWEQKFTMHPEGYNSEIDEKTTEKLEVLNHLRAKVITPLSDLHRKTSQSKKSASHVVALSEFFADIFLPEKLQNKAEMLSVKGYVQTAKEYSQLWEMIVEILSQAHAVLGENEMEFEVFGSLLKLMLAQCDVGSIPVSLDRISVGEMDRMRRRNIKHMMILGASDMRIPKISESNGVFSNDERQRLKEFGIEISCADDELSRELNIIYNCATLPSNSMMMSYSRSTADDAESSPSFLMLTAQKLFNKNIEKVDMSYRKLYSKTAISELASNSFYSADNLSHAALTYLSSIGEGERVYRLKEASETEIGKLSKATVRVLYGKNLRVSAGKADKFMGCRFAYFLQYGLRAKPRKTAGFNPPEFGTFMHFVLENVFKKLYENGELDPKSLDVFTEITEEIMFDYLKNQLKGLDGKSERFKYLFYRLKSTVLAVVRDMIEELMVSEFKPIDFELNFSSENNTAVSIGDSEENSMEITGIADRVDGYMHEGKLYIRVLDYKTGKREFSLSDVSQGLNLQLLMYLFALKSLGKIRYNAEVETAGVLYIPARDSIISKDKYLTDEEILLEKNKEKKRSGLILFDEEIIEAMEHGETKKFIPVTIKKGEIKGDNLATAERMQTLSEHVEKVLKDMATELKNGSIDAQPFYKNETDNYCIFCEYSTTCNFNEKKDKRRYITKKKTDEAWIIMGEEV